MTILTHIQERDLIAESVQKKWNRKEKAGLLTRPFRRDLEPTDSELEIVFGQKQSKGQPRVAKAFVQADKVPAVSVSVADADKPTQTGKPQTSGQDSYKTKTKKRTWILWIVAFVCAAVSATNMHDIAGQIKPFWFDALLVTGLFSLAPFALLYAGVSRLASWIVSGICIWFEVFCNTSGMYRGLAGLGKSGKPYEVWEPGGFIDTVSRVTTLEPRPCALAISAGMAAIVAAVFLTCLIELKK